MKPRFKLERRGKDWCVTGMMGRTVYCSTDYAKAAGVFDFITVWGGFRSVNGAERAEAGSNAPPTHGRDANDL